jgi:hypothetical protein
MSAMIPNVGGHQRSHRLPEVAADLEQRLRKAVASARCEPRDARRLRVEYRRSDADQRHRGEDGEKRRRHRQQQQSDQRERHPRRERVRLRAPVGERADDWLQQRRRHLVGERDQSNLSERQFVHVLENRVGRRQHRLHQIVQPVADADGAKDPERRAVRDDGGPDVASCGLGSIGVWSLSGGGAAQIGRLPGAVLQYNFELRRKRRNSGV